MQFEKLSQGKFAQKGVEIKDGDIVKLLDAGSERESTFQGKTRKQWVFQIETASGDQRLIALNGKSINNLIEAFPNKENPEKSNSGDWVGKPLKAWIVRALVADKMTDVLYLSHPQAEMDRDGNFILDPEFVEKQEPKEAKDA